MARKLPKLNALKAFEAAARHESLSLAADELNVTHSAISRHIRDLEIALRAKLFVRTGRGVQLTEQGELLAKDLSQAFDLMVAATGRFARPVRRRQRLMISSDLSFAALWLVPRLGRFTSTHPGIDLAIDANPRLVDFNKEDVDFGIRFGGGIWRDVEALKLIDAELMLVCNPALVQGNALKTPAGLQGASLIGETAKENWQAWLKAAGIADRVIPSGPTLNGDLAIAAAEAGQGFAVADQIQAGDALLAKRLLCPFDIVVRHNAYYLVNGAGTTPSKAANDFRIWLTAEMKRMTDALAAMKAAKPAETGRRAGAPRTAAP